MLVEVASVEVIVASTKAALLFLTASLACMLHKPDGMQHHADSSTENHSPAARNFCVDAAAQGQRYAGSCPSGRTVLCTGSVLWK
jgi:hypothetical protein